jgi:hypothetical protein
MHFLRRPARDRDQGSRREALGNQTARFRQSITGLNISVAARNMRGLKRMIVSVKGNPSRRDGSAVDAQRTKEQNESSSEKRGLSHDETPNRRALGLDRCVS